MLYTDSIPVGGDTITNDIAYVLNISTEEADELMKGLNEYFNEKYPDFKGKFYTGVSYRHLFIYSCDSVEDSEIL